MSAPADPASTSNRLSRLLGYLEQDGQSLSLLSEAADAAVEAGNLEVASELLDRHAALAPLPPALLNLKGLIALQGRRFADACDVFATLLEGGASDPAVCFNLAWAKAMLAQYQTACELLSEAVVAAVPRAAALKIQTLHHLGELDEALRWGEHLAQLYPDDTALMGELATVAMDAEAPDLARRYAERAGDHFEGLATQGMFALNEGAVDQSMQAFERALASNPKSARALLGKGLGLLTKGDATAAAHNLDRSAEIFGDHLGSWVAAGWAYFVAGDNASARERFEKALALDDTFAETHGGLAVIDIADGRMESARRHTELAQRLDRNSFSGALARSLLLAGAGDEAGAERVRQLALGSKLGASGVTLAQAMAGIVGAGAKPRKG